MLVIECTEGYPDNKGKLAKLHARDQQLHERVGRGVLPVLMTLYERNTITRSNEDMAREEGIALLGKEDLEDLRGIIESGSTVADVEQYIRHKISPGFWGTVRRSKRTLN